MVQLHTLSAVEIQPKKIDESWEANDVIKEKLIQKNWNKLIAK